MNFEPIITKLDFKVDLNRLNTECEEIIARFGLYPNNQIGLTHMPGLPVDGRVFSCIGSLKEGQKERDFSEFDDQFAGTYIHEVFTALPYRFGRIRIMRMQGRRTYSVHSDNTPRIHIPLITNPYAYMIFPEDQIIAHLPADGSVYWTDTTRPHTAINCSRRDRLHLVAALAEED